MCTDYKAKDVLYETLSEAFKEPSGISGPWPLKNCLVCSGEPVKYERKWRGVEVEGIRCSSAILTDTECPEEQQTSNQKRWSVFTSPHLLLSLNRVKGNISFSLLPPHITRIDSFPKGNTFSCTEIPSFFISPIWLLSWNHWRTAMKHATWAWESLFYLLRAYFKGKSNAKNVLALQ